MDRPQKIVSVELWRVDGSPLLAYVEDDAPYRRTMMGFLPPQAREIAYEYMGGRRDVRPSESVDPTDAYSQWRYEDGEEEEEVD